MPDQPVVRESGPNDTESSPPRDILLLNHDQFLTLVEDSETVNKLEREGAQIMVPDFPIDLIQERDLLPTGASKIQNLQADIIRVALRPDEYPRATNGINTPIQGVWVDGLGCFLTDGYHRVEIITDLARNGAYGITPTIPIRIAFGSMSLVLKERLISRGSSPRDTAHARAISLIIHTFESIPEVQGIPFDIPLQYLPFLERLRDNLHLQSISDLSSEEIPPEMDFRVRDLTRKILQDLHLIGIKVDEETVWNALSLIEDVAFAFNLPISELEEVADMRKKLAPDIIQHLRARNACLHRGEIPRQIAINLTREPFSGDFTLQRAIINVITGKVCSANIPSESMHTQGANDMVLSISFGQRQFQLLNHLVSLAQSNYPYQSIDARPPVLSEFTQMVYEQTFLLILQNRLSRVHIARISRLLGAEASEDRKFHPDLLKWLDTVVVRMSEAQIEQRLAEITHRPHREAGCSTIRSEPPQKERRKDRPDSPDKEPGSRTSLSRDNRFSEIVLGPEDPSDRILERASTAIDRLTIQHIKDLASQAQRALDLARAWGEKEIWKYAAIHGLSPKETEKLVEDMEPVLANIGTILGNLNGSTPIDTPKETIGLLIGRVCHEFRNGRSGKKEQERYLAALLPKARDARVGILCRAINRATGIDIEPSDLTLEQIATMLAIQKEQGEKVLEALRHALIVGGDPEDRRTMQLFEDLHPESSFSDDDVPEEDWVW